MRKTNNFKEYDDLGVRFIYPNNWSVQTETWDKGTYGISVDSPEGSFWALAIYPMDVDLDDAAKKILSEMKVEYDEMEEEEIERYVADRVLTGYELNFFYLDLTSIAQALKFTDGRRGYVIYWQTCDRLAVTDENLSRVDVFEAMTHTLVSNLTDQEVEYWDDEDPFFGKTEKQIREEEDRAYYRRRYEQARRNVEEANWRAGGSEGTAFENFILERDNKAEKSEKPDRQKETRDKLNELLRGQYDGVSNEFVPSDESLSDFLRPDDDDENDGSLYGEDSEYEDVDADESDEYDEYEDGDDDEYEEDDERDDRAR